MYSFIKKFLTIIVFVNIYSSQVNAEETINITSQNYAYRINDKDNPDIFLKRGLTYNFKINAVGHPMWIKFTSTSGDQYVYTQGIEKNGTDRGVITFTVPQDAPSNLTYNCQYHLVMRGNIIIVD